MTVQEVIRQLDALAPPSYQEQYDNAGLLVGDAAAELTGVLVSLDCTEAVVEEAERKKCNLVVSHHPILFSGLKRLTGATYVERVIMRAVRSGITLYAIHTNLDNVMEGVNRRIGEKLGLKGMHILRPMAGVLKKLVVFCPNGHAGAVRAALFAAGAGHIGGYAECSFAAEGTGTFTGGPDTNPFVGRAGTPHAEPELRLEVVFDAGRKADVLKALRTSHPYEEPAFDVYAIENEHQRLGAGMIGTLEREQAPREFLLGLKAAFGSECVRHTRLPDHGIRTVAVCGGSGSFLLPDAIRQGAQAFVTADFKYHQFFDADNRILVADIGHFESEQFTVDLLADFLKDKIPTFALHLADTRTNPVYYI